MSDTRFATPEDAEAAFYDAFQRHDLEAMMRVWADEETIVCIHPMGPRLGGRRAIAESWREIFEAGSSMRFELTELERSRDETIAVHCLRENIVHGAGFAQRAQVLATNVYKMTAAGWRMIVHHASPGNVETETGGTDSHDRDSPTLH